MTSFGKYQVVELIGQGGFGRVYKAHDPALKRNVAVKTCSLQDEDMRARFGREAEIAANLRHPHIVTVYDYGHENGEPYLVQEYLDGEDLDHKLKRGDRIEPSQLVEWLRQTAEGLEYAHRNGVLHRDVKPANIRVLPAGDVRIMDFGIAKLLEEDRQLTRTGMSVGTAGYLAPEQLMGLTVDRRADIFSFGAMAYELLAGQKPFEADSFTAILYRIAHEEPTPLPLVAPGADPRLVALVERCLRKKADERFDSFADVVAELRTIASTAAPASAAGTATQLFSGGTAAAAAGSASAGSAHVSPAAAAGGSASGARHPESGQSARDGVATGPRRRRVSPAAWGLVGATVIVAVFGVLNISGIATSSSAPAGDRTPADAGVAATQDEAPSGAGVDAPGMASLDAPGYDERSAASAGGSAAGLQAAPGTSPSAVATGGLASPAAGGQAAAGAGSRTAAPAAAGTGSAAAPAALHARRVVVLVAAQSRDLADAAEATIVTELKQVGFDVRDSELLTGTDAAGMAAGQVPNLLGVASAAGAASVIVVDVSADASAIVAGMYSGTAAVNLRIYGTARRELMGNERFEIGSARSRAEPGPTPLAAATAAVRAASFQAARSAVRRIDAAGF